MSDSFQNSQNLHNKRRKNKQHQPGYRKRTTRKEAQKEGKQTYVCEFCPIQNKKVYQSYPALYTHVRNKHNDKTITSAKEKDQTKKPVPVHKLNSIIHTSPHAQRQILQTHLIDRIQSLQLKLSQQLNTRRLIDLALIGLKDRDQAVRAVVKGAEELAVKIGIDKKLMEKWEDQEIFKQYFGKISKISFGKDIVRFFSLNKETAIKLQLQFILIQGRENELINENQFQRFNSIIWGTHEYIYNLIRFEWKHWQSIIKISLNQPYPDFSSNEESQNQLIEEDPKKRKHPSKIQDKDDDEIECNEQMIESIKKKLKEKVFEEKDSPLIKQKIEQIQGNRLIEDGEPQVLEDSQYLQKRREEQKKWQ